MLAGKSAIKSRNNDVFTRLHVTDKPKNKNKSMTALAQEKKQDDFFQLDGLPETGEHFELESDAQDLSSQTSPPAQAELYLPATNPEAAPESQQPDLRGLEKPVHAISVEGINQTLEFHYANTLLESLEAQGVQVPYQCREGYCGGCRTLLTEGEVAYLEEPLAWLNEGEILPCCCVPKTALKLKLKG